MCVHLFEKKQHIFQKFGQSILIQASTPSCSLKIIVDSGKYAICDLIALSTNPKISISLLLLLLWAHIQRPGKYVKRIPKKRQNIRGKNK